MAAVQLGFGIEIEAVIALKPSQHGWDGPKCYKHISDALNRAGVRATNFPGIGVNRRHPEYYDRWYICADGSLEQQPNCVTFEAVSPKLNQRTQDSWEQDITKFWNTVRRDFKMKENFSCGSHIHIAPVGRKYTLNEVKRIAFAACYYEPYVISILPKQRRDHPYCVRNSKRATRMGSLFKQRNPEAWQTIASDIKAQNTSENVCTYMQGDGRYVLWNFQNLIGSGTVEFRGGRHLRGKYRSIWWITFVITFISMALKENLVENRSFRVPSNKTELEVGRFWSKVREHAQTLGMGEKLPQHFKHMSEKLSAS